IRGQIGDAPGMLESLLLLLVLVRAARRPRVDLVAENLLLGQQFAVLSRPSASALGCTPATRSCGSWPAAGALRGTGTSFKNHISAILGKTGLRDRTQAALFAVRHCLAG